MRLLTIELLRGRLGKWDLAVVDKLGSTVIAMVAETRQPTVDSEKLTSRPHIICHMHTLLNGKIAGIANPTCVGMRSQEFHFDLFLRKD